MAVAASMPAGCEEVEASVAAVIVFVATTVAAAGAIVQPSLAHFVMWTMTAATMTGTRICAAETARTAAVGGTRRLGCRLPVVVAQWTEETGAAGCRAPPTATPHRWRACRRCRPELSVAVMTTAGTFVRPIAPMPSGVRRRLVPQRGAAARTMTVHPFRDRGSGCPRRRPAAVTLAAAAMAVVSVGVGVGRMAAHRCHLEWCGQQARMAVVAVPPTATEVCLRGAPAPTRGNGRPAGATPVAAMVGSGIALTMRRTTRLGWAALVARRPAVPAALTERGEGGGGTGAQGEGVK